jgi:hypothetical protein
VIEIAFIVVVMFVISISALANAVEKSRQGDEL